VVKVDRLLVVLNGVRKRRSNMIEIMTESSGSALALRATGKLTDADYKDVMIPKLEEIIKQSGKAKVLLYLPKDFAGWEAHAAWDDARFGLQHRNDFEKLAVVGGAKWIEWATKIGAYFMKGEVKTFPEALLTEALDWIRA
jgi:SpoIIAA-like